VYGPRGRNFLATMLALAAAREELRVVDDQRGAPTSSLFLAEATARALRAIPAAGVASGIYHLSAAGETTWAGFARAIFERAAARPGFRAPRVVPIATAEYPTPARRPRYSVLSHRKFASAFGFEPDSWEAQLDACFAAMAGG
jgi:dTDP-4-dehydrorhamnose reductase